MVFAKLLLIVDVPLLKEFLEAPAFLGHVDEKEVCLGVSGEVGFGVEVLGADVVEGRFGLDDELVGALVFTVLWHFHSDVSLIIFFQRG